MQTPVLAQVATNMVKLYVDGGHRPWPAPQWWARRGHLECGERWWRPLRRLPGCAGNPVTTIFPYRGVGDYLAEMRLRSRQPPTSLMIVCLTYVAYALNVSVSGLAANTEYIMYNYMIGGGGRCRRGTHLDRWDGNYSHRDGVKDDSPYQPLRPRPKLCGADRPILCHRPIDYTLSNIANPLERCAACPRASGSSHICSTAVHDEQPGKRLGSLSLPLAPGSPINGHWDTILATTITRRLPPTRP